MNNEHLETALIAHLSQQSMMLGESLATNRKLADVIAAQCGYFHQLQKQRDDWLRAVSDTNARACVMSATQPTGEPE